VLPPDLVEVLVCPKSKEKLLYFPRGEANTADSEAFLFCPASRLRYRIDAGVPVMLVEEAAEVSASEATRLVTRARELGLS